MHECSWHVEERRSHITRDTAESAVQVVVRSHVSPSTMYTMTDSQKQASQTSCNTSCTAIKPYEDKTSFTPATDSPHVSGRPDVVTFPGTSIHLRCSPTTSRLMFRIEMFGANRHVGRWALAYEQYASHIQANRGYDPTIPSIQRPLFQLRHHHGYTNYVCTVTSACHNISHPGGASNTCI